MPPCTDGAKVLSYIPAMGLLIRTLLIWALVLAVPAQGLAAATLAFCGPGHAGAAAQAGVPTVQTHVHGSAEDRAPHVHATTAASADGRDAAASAATDSAEAPAAGAHKCSACATCCSVGALLNAALTVPAPDLTTPVDAAVVPTVDAFAADGPDRPPRTVLA